MAMQATAHAADTEARTSIVVPLAVMAVVYLIYAWDRIVLPVELVEVRAAYGLSLSVGSLLASMFTMGLALTALPAGLVLVRWGTRATLVAGAILFSVCTAYTAFGHGLADLLVARIAAGVGEGLYNVAMYSFLGSLTVRFRGVAAGSAGTLFGLGILSGPPVITLLHLGFDDWRAPFIVLALTGIAGALLLRLSLSARIGGPAKSTVPMLPRLARMMTRKTLVVCILAGVNGVGVYAFLSVYVTFLRTIWHVEQTTASYMFSAYGLGSLLGGIPMGYLADRIGRRRFLLAAFPLCGLAGTAAFAVAPAIVPAVMVNFCLGVLLNGIFSNCFALMQDQVERSEIPIATGLVGTVVFTTASFSGWLIVTASGTFGWMQGAGGVYLVPYMVGGLLLLCTPALGRKPAAAVLPAQGA